MSISIDLLPISFLQSLYQSTLASAMIKCGYLILSPIFTHLEKWKQNIKLNIASVYSVCRCHVLCSTPNLGWPKCKAEILRIRPPTPNPWPVVSASPGNFLEMQILGLYPRPTESETLEMGAIWILTSLPGDFSLVSLRNSRRKPWRILSQPSQVFPHLGVQIPFSWPWPFIRDSVI